MASHDSRRLLFLGLDNAGKTKLLRMVVDQRLVETFPTYQASKMVIAGWSAVNWNFEQMLKMHNLLKRLNMLNHIILENLINFGFFYN